VLRAPDLSGSFQLTLCDFYITTENYRAILVQPIGKAAEAQRANNSSDFVRPTDSAFAPASRRNAKARRPRATGRFRDRLRSLGSSTRARAAVVA